MKKKFKDTKVGKFLSKKAPKILGLIGDNIPGIDFIKSVIQDDSEMSDTDKLEALKLTEETYKIELNYHLENTTSARNMYNKSKDMVDWIAKLTVRWNHWLMILLTVINILCAKFFDSVVLAMISQVIGMIIGHLANERATVFNYYLGSKKENKKKEEE